MISMFFSQRCWNPLLDKNCMRINSTCRPQQNIHYLNYIQLKFFLDNKYRGKTKKLLSRGPYHVTTNTRAQVHVSLLKMPLHMYSITLSSSYLSFLVPVLHITALQNISMRLSENIHIYLLHCWFRKLADCKKNFKVSLYTKRQAKNLQYVLCRKETALLNTDQGVFKCTWQVLTISFFKNITITGHNTEAPRLSILPLLYTGKQQCKLHEDSEATYKRNIQWTEKKSLQRLAIKIRGEGMRKARKKSNPLLSILMSLLTLSRRGALAQRRYVAGELLQFLNCLIKSNW